VVERSKKRNRSTMTYYNTGNESGSEIKQFVKSTQNQDFRVWRMLQYMDKNIEGQHTPRCVWRNIGHDEIELTSVRRSLNTLEKKGKVKRTVQVRNEYGRKEWVYVPA